MFGGFHGVVSLLGNQKLHSAVKAGCEQMSSKHDGARAARDHCYVHCTAICCTTTIPDWCGMVVPRTRFDLVSWFCSEIEAASKSDVPSGIFFILPFKSFLSGIKRTREARGETRL